MFIYTEIEQPYGLLSNFASTPFTLRGVKWDNVSEFIFVNMFKESSWRERMRKHVLYFPFENFLELQNEKTNDDFTRHILYALEAKIDSDKGLISMLRKADYIDYPREQEVPGDGELQNFLNSKLAKIKASSERIPLLRLKQIVDGVEKALKSGTPIDETSTIEDLVRFEIKISSSRLDNDEVFMFLDTLVPYLKFKIGNEKTVKAEEKELQNFKTNLFDINTDYVLRTEYPDIAKEDYPKAKQQQLERLSFFEKMDFVEDVYQVFLDKTLPQEVVNQAGDAPVKTIFKFEPDHSGTGIRIMDDRHPLSPYNISPVTVDKISYKSPIHYVYQKLFDDISPRTKAYTFATGNLPEVLERMNDDHARKELIENASAALWAKFKTYPVLVNLLRTTGNEDIVWSDATDPVLGIGKDRQGENIAGQIMMLIRSKGVSSKKKVTDYPTPLSNIFLREWTIMRMRDILNSMTTLISPNVKDLQDLYRFPVSLEESFKGLYPEDRKKLWEIIPTMTDAMLKIVWGVSYPQMFVLTRLTDQELVDDVVKAQNYYLGKIPSNEEKDVANKFMIKYFSEHQDNMKLGNSAFLARKIFSGMSSTMVSSSYNIFSEAKNPRVFYWYDLAKLIAR